MEWIRTYPVGGRGGVGHSRRSWIIDATMRPIEMDHDYRPVLEQLGEGAVIVEWDIAVSREDRLIFQAHCEAAPGSVRVAPYVLYPSSTGLPHPVLAHRRLESGGGLRWIRQGEQVCDWFGLGMTYLPAPVIRQCLAETDGPMSDASISEWHARTIKQLVRVDWIVRPIHLHYSAGDLALPIHAPGHAH